MRATAVSVFMEQCVCGLGATAHGTKILGRTCEATSRLKAPLMPELGLLLLNLSAGSATYLWSAAIPHPASPREPRTPQAGFSLLRNDMMSLALRFTRGAFRRAECGRNQSPLATFFRHESSRRKLQHGPARDRRVVHRRDREWRQPGGTGRQESDPVRRPDARGASRLRRQANHLRFRPAAGPRGRRAVRAQHQSARTLARAVRAAALLEIADAPCARQQYELSPFCHLAHKSDGVIPSYLHTSLIPQKPFDGVAWAEVFHEMDEGTRSPDRADDGVCSIGVRQDAGSREDGCGVAHAALCRNLSHHERARA